jgi:DNA topoisomerase-1
VKIGRFGPVVQIGSVDDEEKPRFAQMKKGQSMSTITLEEALDLFKLPRTVGEFEDKVVVIGTGRFGPYIRHNNKFVSLPKEADPMTISLEESIQLILKKRETEAQRHLLSFEQDPEMEVINGRFGPYIQYQGANYKLPKDLDVAPNELSYERCLEIVKEQQEKGDAPKRGRAARTTKAAGAKATTAKATTAKKATATKKSATTKSATTKTATTKTATKAATVKKTTTAKKATTTKKAATKKVKEPKEA